jgi:hypothetical protein
VTFRAAPVIIPSQHTFNTPRLWEAGCILKIGDLYLFDHDVLVNITAVNQNVVRFDI